MEVLNSGGFKCSLFVPLAQCFVLFANPCFDSIVLFCIIICFVIARALELGLQNILEAETEMISCLIITHLATCEPKRINGIVF